MSERPLTSAGPRFASRRAAMRALYVSSLGLAVAIAVVAACIPPIPRDDQDAPVVPDAAGPDVALVDAAVDAPSAIDADAARPFLQVASIAAGEHFVCVLRLDATVWCWGKNDVGQTANLRTPSDPVWTDPRGVTWPYRLPSKVGALGPVRQVVAGLRHACALGVDGLVRCWGEDLEGVLARDSVLDASCTDPKTGGTLPCSPTPVVIAGIPGVVEEIVSGGFHVCARTKAKDLYCWGRNYTGQTGAGHLITPVRAPVLVQPLGGDVSTPGAGLVHSCAMRASGELWCWGRNDLGQLGHPGDTDPDCNGFALRCGIVPRPIEKEDGGALGAFVAMQGGSRSSCALRADGSVWCWGTNNRGDLGRGFTDTTDVPRPHAAPVLGLPKIAVLASAGVGLSALDEDGLVWAWGFNGDGELGDGTTDGQSCVRQEKCRPDAARVKGLPRVRMIAVGHGTKYAIDTAGQVWGWGESASGSLGRAPLAPGAGDRANCANTNLETTPCHPLPVVVQLP